MKREDLEKRIEILEDNIDTCIVYLNTVNIADSVRYTIMSILENTEEWKEI